MGSPHHLLGVARLAAAAAAPDTVRMEVPETRYARSGDRSIAYQAVGDGPFDVVFVPGFISHVELLGVERA